MEIRVSISESNAFSIQDYVYKDGFINIRFIRF